MKINELLIASNNLHKITEIKRIFGDKCRLYSLKEKGISVDVEETGTTFEENSRLKAETLCKLTGLPCLADDSGLSVDALGGAPGVYSARYAGECCDTAKNNALLLSNLSEVSNRRAHFVCCVTLSLPDGEIISAFGEAEGYILNAPRGENGFGYDPLFFSYDLQKSFAEADAEEKNAVSHRGRALEKLYEILTKKEYI